MKLNKLARSVMLLNTKQVLHLQDVMVTAGLAFETGEDYQDIFRTEKYKHPAGVEHRIYKALQNATGAEIDALLRRLVPTTRSASV